MVKSFVLTSREDGDNFKRFITMTIYWEIMRDIDIRQVLLSSLQKRHSKSRNTLLIEELALCQGDARVDVAVINGSIHGYEIKSERDTLTRLSGQQEIYNKVLDHVTVIGSTCHLTKIEKMVPSWWGICDAEFRNGKLEIQEIRPSSINTAVDPDSVVQLLWRDEALSILIELNMHKGIASKSRKVLWGKIVECLPPHELRAVVRQKLKARQDWRSRV